jgi:hypothetical protein
LEFERPLDPHHELGFVDVWAVSHVFNLPGAIHLCNNFFQNSFMASRPCVYAGLLDQSIIQPIIKRLAINSTQKTVFHPTLLISDGAFSIFSDSHWIGLFQIESYVFGASTGDVIRNSSPIPSANLNKICMLPEPLSMRLN